MERLINIIKKNYVLIIFLIISLIFLTVFAAIFEDIWTKDAGIISLDNNILEVVRNNRTDFTNEFFKLFTNLGDIIIVLIIAAILSIILYIKKYYRYLIAMLIALAGDAIFVFLIKDVVKRARPEIANALITENGFSFPSGHAFIAVCFYGLLTYFAFKQIKNKFLKVLSLIIGIIIILLLAFSRLYLGVHYPSDVLASLTISTIFTSSLIFFLEYKFRDNSHYEEIDKNS